MKYYYYVAIISDDRKVSYTCGTVKTKTNDFPLLEIQSKLSEHYIVAPNNAIITFYKEITKENYKSYNNEQ